MNRLRRPAPPAPGSRAGPPSAAAGHALLACGVAMLVAGACAVALLAGYADLAAFGLRSPSPALSAGVTLARMGAAAVSLAVTAAVLLLVRRPRAPAGATRLIVGLGLLRTPASLVVAFGSVCLVAPVDWIYNLLSGEPMPV